MRVILCVVMLGSFFIYWVSSNSTAQIPSTWQSAGMVLPVEAKAATENSDGPVGGGEQAVSNTSASSQPGQPARKDCSLPARYPEAIRQWCRLVEQYADQNHLDPALVAAVMLQESGGNPDAYSKSGAVGLMQVMPRDGLAAKFTCSGGRPCFASRPTIKELGDPEYNIAFGTRMLSGLITRYGSVRDGLMHYGPANVEYYYADKVIKIFENYQ
jgi:soluble lytic murein transglycosylase-like protein